MKFAAALLLFLPATLIAQAPAATGKQASCKANKAALTPAMVAFEKDEYKKAENLFTTELADHKDDPRLREAHIRNLLARSEKTDLVKARELATAFAAQMPQNGYALISVAEADNRDGLLADGYAEAATAQRADPCNPRVYATLAAYETMISLHATAARHIALAHSLDPFDDAITRQWLQYQPIDQQMGAWKSFVDSSPSLTDKKRASAKENIGKAEGAPADECRLVSSKSRTTIPLQEVREAAGELPYFGTAASFNGKSRRVVFHTGVSGILLTAGAAQSLGLVDEYTFRSTPEDPENRVARVAKLKIGELEFENCRVTITPARGVDEMTLGSLFNFDAFVGTGIFTKFLLDLNYKERRIDIAPLPGEASQTLSLTNGHLPGTPIATSMVHPDTDRMPAPGDGWTPFYHFADQMLVPTQVNSGAVGLFFLNSNYESSFISLDAARAVTRVDLTDQFRAFYDTEDNNGYMANNIVLHFGGVYFPQEHMPSAVMHARSRHYGTSISGYIGLPAIRQMDVQIDSRDSLVRFTVKK